MRGQTLGCVVGSALAAHPLGPGSGQWAIETPEEHGIATASLQAAKDFVFAARQSRDCLVVIKDGALIFEEYSSETYNHTVHAGHSMTKTLGALIAGYAVTHKGLDIDADITDAYGVSSPRPYPVTSRQIMSQSLAGSHGAGEKWKYDAIGHMWINTMANVTLAATGVKPTQIWKEQFEIPLGFDSLTFDGADTMWADGSMGTCRDYARLGQLMLNKGKWKGLEKPIISEEYMHELSTPQTHYDPYPEYSNPCYGLLTWLTNVGKVSDDTPYPGRCHTPDTYVGIDPPSPALPKGSPPDVFFAAGLQGQITMVLPSHNAVVVSMGATSVLQEDYVPVDMYNGFCKYKVFED